MKHKVIDGVCLNLNKKWSHLSQKQKHYILENARDKYIAFTSEYKRHPSKNEYKDIINQIYDLILDRKMHISYREVYMALCAKKNRYRKITIQQA